jgi:hypothetical protein
MAEEEVTNRIADVSPAEDRGPVKVEAYGISGVMQALQGLDFPAGKNEILRKIKGRETISWSADRTLDIQSIIESLPDSGYDSVAELVRAISERVPEEARTR